MDALAAALRATPPVELDTLAQADRAALAELV